MRPLIRLLAILVPVFVAASMGAAAQAGILAQRHVSQAKAIGFVVVVFLLGWAVLQVTRKKNGRRQRPARRTARVR